MKLKDTMYAIIGTIEACDTFGYKPSEECQMAFKKALIDIDDEPIQEACIWLTKNYQGKITPNHIITQINHQSQKPVDRPKIKGSGVTYTNSRGYRADCIYLHDEVRDCYNKWRASSVNNGGFNEFFNSNENEWIRTASVNYHQYLHEGWNAD